MNLEGVGKYFLMILIVMVGIVAVKYVGNKWNVPGISYLAKQV